MNTLSNPPVVLALNLPRLAGGNAPDSADVSSERQRGYAVGYAAGARKAQEELRVRTENNIRSHELLLTNVNEGLIAALHALQVACDGVGRIVAGTVIEAERSLAVTALTLAETILGVELSNTDTGARAALSRVLGHPDIGQVVSIQMNPEDLALISPVVPPGGVSLTSDATLPRGSARATMPSGFLDARLDTALARATVALMSDD